MLLSLKSILTFAAVGAAALSALPSQAQTLYSGIDMAAGQGDPHPLSDSAATSFGTAASGLGLVNTINFENATVGASGGLLAPGVSFTTTALPPSPFSDGFVLDAPAGAPTADFGYNTTPNGANYLFLDNTQATFTFTQPIQAFGAYLTGVQLDGETITLSDGSVISIPNPGLTGGCQFLGFTDPGKTITSVTINPYGDAIGVDDIQYVTNPVPEASTTVSFGLLLALGMGGVVITARKKKAVASA
ncbi:MAG: hypothetical protein ACRYFS_08125 [Janthinobacterium lividum]